MRMYSALLIKLRAEQMAKQMHTVKGKSVKSSVRVCATGPGSLSAASQRDKQAVSHQEEDRRPNVTRRAQLTHSSHSGQQGRAGQEI